MPKYVFSANLEGAAWENTTVVRGDVVKEVTKLKYEHDGNLLIWGHTQLAETLLANQLIDILDLSVHPVIVGTGKLFFREGQQINLRLASTKVFSNIAKLTYECRY
jgi:dihydrofolate reductase